MEDFPRRNQQRHALLTLAQRHFAAVQAQGTQPMPLQADKSNIEARSEREGDELVTLAHFKTLVGRAGIRSEGRCWKYKNFGRACTGILQIVITLPAESETLLVMPSLQIRPVASYSSSAITAPCAS